jgi:hypothetical protein
MSLDVTMSARNGRLCARPQTLSQRALKRERARKKKRLPVLDASARPDSRADCREAARPCLFVTCRFHLYVDVNPQNGSLKLNFPDKEPWELPETCSLDVAERGGLTLDEIGSLLNVTRERARQVEQAALVKLKLWL